MFRYFKRKRLWSNINGYSNAFNEWYDTTIAIRKLTDQQKAQIPIIALTANAFAEDRQKALAVGMNDFIAKPIDLQILLPLLAKYL